MYVRDVARGRGVARALLARIELAAREAALAALRLETGDRQIAAMRLYERAGFRRCPPFGDYAAMATAAIATSVFFEKSLAGEDQAPGSAASARCRSRSRRAIAPHRRICTASIPIMHDGD